MRGQWSPARWAATQRPATLFVVRLVIVAKVMLLAVIGVLYLLFAEWPEGAIVASAVFGVAIVLLVLAQFTNPRGRDRGRW